MPKTKRKSTRQFKHLRTSALLVENSDGPGGVLLLGGDGKNAKVPCGASIQIGWNLRKTLNLSAQTGGPQIMMWDMSQAGHTSLSLAGLMLMNAKGMLGLEAILGCDPESDAHRLMLFKKGVHSWHSPSGDGKSRSRALSAFGYVPLAKPSRKPKATAS